MEEKETMFEELSQEELQREADEIRAIIDQEPDLQDVYVTEEMNNRLMDRIRKYEEEKAIENLSEADKEALRLGKELQERRHRRKTPRNRKIWIALVATMVMVIGVSVTSVGGKNILIEVFEKAFGDGDKTYIDSGEKNIPITEITEEQAYVDVKKVFGNGIVRLAYVPENAEFLDMQLDTELQEAMLYYSMGDTIMSFRIVSRYVESSLGIETQDKLMQEYVIELPETSVDIAEYRIEETGELEYMARFSYKNNKYYVIVITEKQEFEKIIKNMHFF